jgi:cell division protein FtsI/penicillin-binding protein 2
MVFEPGSIFKVGVVAAALNEGRVATNDLFDCENGSWSFGGKPVRDFHPYGVLDVTGILRKSSNIGAAKIAVKLGPKNLHRYLKAYGFGRPTGLEVTGEEFGILNPPSKWSKISLVRVAMGHEIAGDSDSDAEFDVLHRKRRHPDEAPSCPASGGQRRFDPAGE